MAGENRHLRGKIKTVLSEVYGELEYKAGDLVFLNNTNGTVGLGAYGANFLLQADNRVYPLENHRPATDTSTWNVRLSNQFMGVAMEGSPLGVTEKITVATTGIFRYSLNGGISAVTTGSKVSAVSTGWTNSGATGSLSQAVVNHAVESANGTTVYLGNCVKTESGASFIDFELWSAIYKGALT